MTKVTMPEPVAYRSKESPYLFSLGGPGTDGFDGLITTTQAEAYADAMVREALEQAAGIIKANAEACDSGTRIMLRANAEVVLALISSTPARPESEQ